MRQDRIERIARNESTFRATNETLNLGCTTLVRVDLEAYEAVRADARRFLIAPGHEAGEAEDVVERQAEYWVVHKRESARDVVEASDPRRGA